MIFGILMGFGGSEEGEIDAVWRGRDKGIFWGTFDQVYLHNLKTLEFGCDGV